MNCPYCLNRLNKTWMNTFQCDYCPGEPTIWFDSANIPCLFIFSLRMNDDYYKIQYEIKEKKLSVFKSDCIFPPNYNTICLTKYNHNSPKRAYQDTKRILQMKAFL